MVNLTNIHAGLVISACAAFIPICSISVALRFYARKRKAAGLGVDDWLVLVALIFTIAMAITLLAEVGVGQLGYSTPSEPTSVGKPDSNIAFWPGELLQIPALTFVKLSFIFFYRRIFVKNAAPKFNIVTWLMIVIIVLWGLSFFFIITFICGTDFSAYWTNRTVEKENCVNTDALHNAFAITDVITDFLILCLPIPMIWSLHLSYGRKWGVSAIFSLGALTIAASIVRLIVFFQATSVLYDPSADFELLCTGGLYWSMIESGLGVLAACLPTQYSLLSSKGVQTVVQSVRSAISLQSIRSASHNISSIRNERHFGPRTDPWAPETQHITTSVEGQVDERSDVESRYRLEDRITITRGFEVAK